MVDWEKNELRNLYRKDGIYKVIKTLNDKDHIFAVFDDLEKAISYRDLFELAEWDLNLKGITDINHRDINEDNVVVKTDTNKQNHKPKVKPKSKKKEEVEELEIIDKLIETELNESQNNLTEIEEEINQIDELLNDELSIKKGEEDNIIESDNLEEITIENSIEEFDDKYIYFDKDRGYTIKKVINNKSEYFGVYETLNEAITARNYFEEHNWNLEDRLKFTKTNEKKENKNISKTKEGYFIVSKYLNKKNVKFGRFYNLKDAVIARDYFEEHGWNIEDKDKFKDKHVNTIKENPKRYIHEHDGLYKVIKEINKKMVSFGQYRTLEDAIKVRDYFEENGWDVSKKTKFQHIQYHKTQNREMRYIRQTPDGKYSLNKNNAYWGTFDSLEEAKDARAFFEDNNWDVKYKEKYFHTEKPVSENYFENNVLF